MKAICRRAVKVVAYFFVVLFSFASVQKLFDFRNFRAQLKVVPEVGNYGELATFLIVIVQVLVIALLCWGRSRFFGFLLTVVVLSVFTIYMAKILVEKNLPCECLGIVKGLNWHQNFFLNLFFLLVAFLGISGSAWQIMKK